MAANLLQKRTFTAALPVFLATPPTAEEIGQIVVAANTAQRGVYIGVADDAAVALGAAWHQIDGGAAGINVNANIPAGTGASDEDDINEFDFSAIPAVPADTGAPEQALVEAGTNLYFVCARSGSTYLYGGAVPAAIGNELTPFDGSNPQGAPTDATHVNVTTPMLIPFGGNPDAMVQTPAAGSPQNITSGAVGDINLSLIPFAAQTAPLLVAGALQLNSNGFASIVQGAVGSGIALEMEQFVGAGALIAAHSRGTPGTDLVTVAIEADPLGDGVERAVIAGDAVSGLVLDNAIVDGGVFV